MADSSNRWADCSSSSDEDDESFFDKVGKIGTNSGNKSTTNNRPQPTEHAPSGRSKKYHNNNEDFVGRAQPQPRHMAIKQSNQQYHLSSSKQQQHTRQFGSKDASTNVRRSYSSRAEKGDEYDDWKTLARNSSKILQMQTSSSLPQRPRGGRSFREGDPMEATASSWIEKRQMKEQRRIQEEVIKAEHATKVLEEEKRLRLKQQTAGLKAALSSIQRERMSEPSTAATNALVLEEAAQRGTHNPIHYDDKTTSSTAIATAAGEQNTSQEEKNPQLHKVYRGEEPQRQQLERQQPCQHKEQQQQQQQQQQHQTKQQLPYPTKILSKPRQEAVSTITTSEPSSIANSCSSPVLPSTAATPHHTAVRTSVTPLRTDESVLLTVDGADTAKPRLEEKTTLNQGIASEQKKLTSNDDGSYKAPTNEPEQAKVNEQGKQNTTAGLSKGKEVMHKEKLKESKREAPISGKSEDKISSPDEHLVSSKNDARDKDAGYSFSFPNKRNVTKPVAKHNSGKKKEHIQSFKKDDVSTKKSIIEPTEDEYDVTVRIVMPDGKEILQRATADKKKKPQKPSATATTTATSSTSHSPQSKYTIDEKVENTLISEPVKSLPKSGRHHGQQQFSEKKQLDSKLHLREGAVKSEKLDKESALKKQHTKESRMKRSSLQKNLQEEEQKTELPLPKHTDDSKSLQKLAQPLVEAEVEVKTESREVTSLTQAQEEQQPKEKVGVPKPPKTSLRKSMEETESMNKELPLKANAVTTMLHPSGKSVMFSRNKVGNNSRNSGASFQYQGRGRSSGGGRRGASTTAMVPKGTDQSQSVIKINKDVPQSVAEASDVTERAEGHTIPKFGVTEKLERDSAAETLTLAKESQNGDGTTEQTSTSKSRKSHGKHIIRSAQMAHGGGRGRNIVHARGKRHFKPPHSTEH